MNGNGSGNGNGNGRVFSIIGNHEIMNVEGDFRYVSLKEFKSFKEHLSNLYHRQSKFPYHSKTLKKNSYKLNPEKNNESSKLPLGFRERLYAFSPTGLCANYIGSNSYTMLQIGNWLFCHGSPVLSTVNTYKIDMINNIVSMYLLGIDSDNHEIEKLYEKITQSKESKSSDSYNESVLWDRTFGDEDIEKEKENKLCGQIDKILNSYNKKNNSALNATHIAVGHTVQSIGINSICNERVWRTDAAMSRAFGSISNSSHRRPQVLEISGNGKVGITLNKSTTA